MTVTATVTDKGLRLGIVGLGLIGGSLALAARGAGFARTVIAWDSDRQVLQRGLDFGVVDEVEDSLDALAQRVDLLVLATPTRASERLLEHLLAMPGDAHPWVTDVASVKGTLAAIAEAAPGAAARFVPGHPIAGSERSGVEAADRHLFEHHRVILTPLPFTDPEGVALVTALWESCGAAVVALDVEEHDAVLAATSHLPHVLAFTLVNALASSERSSDIFRFAAGGFRDFTRIASSDPVMWRDVALANAPALLAAIDEFGTQLQALRDAIEQRDAGALHRTFVDAKSARDEFARELHARRRRAPPGEHPGSGQAHKRGS